MKNYNCTERGCSIRLDGLGTFSTTVKGFPAESEAAVTAKHIKKVNIQFRPGKTLRQAMETAEFEKVKR